MLTPPPLQPGNPQEQVETWIDRVVDEGHDAREIAAGIASLTQPGETRDLVISPELLGNEGWFWPWNRAGFRCLQREGCRGVKEGSR